MAQLNRNNFVTWFGTVNDAPFSINLTGFSVTAQVIQKSIDIDPFVNASGTYQISKDNIEITDHDNPTKPPIYNPDTQKITYYLPQGVAIGNARLLKYRVFDLIGHPSPVATITINIIAASTGWRAYQASAQCRKDAFNRTTGQAYYMMLEKYYISTGASFQPLTLKTNTSGQADFVPDYTDLVNCPLDPFFKKLTVTNQRNTGVIIQKIDFTRSGGAVVTAVINLTQADGSKDVSMPADCISFTVTMINPHAGENLIWANINHLGMYGESMSPGTLTYTFNQNTTPPAGLIAGDLYII